MNKRQRNLRHWARTCAKGKESDLNGQETLANGKETRTIVQEAATPNKKTRLGEF